jgi:hypothetical protein
VAELGAVSRLRLTNQHVDDLVSPGRLRFGLWKVPLIDLAEYDLYTVTQGDLQRIDRIASQMLGDPALWWAIAIVNNIANPLKDLTVGTTLVIPHASSVSAALAQGVTEE